MTTILDKNSSFIHFTSHPEVVLSTLSGALLGNAHCSFILHNVRISFMQETKNIEYLMSIWKTLSEYGYCTDIRPKIKIRPSSKGIIRYFSRFHTYTSPTLNFLYYEWYRNGSSDIKRVPLDILKYLSPLALACWAQENGDKIGSGFKFNIKTYPKEDVELLKQALYKRYGILTSIHKGGCDFQFLLNINVESMPIFIKIVKPYFVKSMYYKLGL